jgi:hypothetical protein
MTPKANETTFWFVLSSAAFHCPARTLVFMAEMQKSMFILMLEQSEVLTSLSLYPRFRFARTPLAVVDKGTFEHSMDIVIGDGVVTGVHEVVKGSDRTENLHFAA